MLGRKVTLVMLLLAGNLGTFGTASFAATNTTMQFGQVALKDTQLNSLQHSGMLKLDNVQFKGSLLVNGKLEAKGSTFTELAVNGDCDLTDVKVTGPANVNGQIKVKDSKFSSTLNAYGYLNALKSTFEKAITVDGKNIDFDSSTVQDINVQASNDKIQTLKLINTQVSGNVLFESGQGIIQVDEKSQITGKVTGATVQKK